MIARVVAGALVAIIAGGTAAAEARAEEVSLQLSGGATRFFGDLTGTDLGPAIDAQLKTLFVRIGESRFSAHLGFDLFLAFADHTGSEFPYQPGASLSIRGFLFLPNLCWDASSTTRLCAAIGQGTVNVNADGDRRDYGTWNYELSVRQMLYRDLFATASTKYVGRVEQEVRGLDSYFSIGFASLGAGWAW